jgi:Big-like domain-containing protein
MLGTRFNVAVTIALVGLLLPASGAASQDPTLLSQATSPPVRDMPAQARHGGEVEEKKRHRPPHERSGNVVDPVVQTSTTTPAAAQGLGQWEGLGAGYPGFVLLGAPADPNIAVGPNHVVQWVNNAFVVFDKSGVPITNVIDDGTFWSALATCDQLGGFSDPIVQYDRVADRWVVAEVAIPLFPPFIGVWATCFAVSTTSDPTGSYRMWAYGFSTTVPDYPKVAVWPDGYYVTWNMFPNGTAFTGARACAWNRVDMLTGVGAPRFKCFQLSSAYASLLPADVDGPTQPPPGSPNYFMNVDAATGALNLWKFHVDWTNLANSTFTGPISIPGTAPFQGPCIDDPDCIPQPDTTQKLDALGDRLMYRLAYRNFGDHESIVATHTVVAPTGNTGVRWYEIRSPNSAPTIYQQGTFAPDTDSRWMASIAMDHNGNIGVGYSVSSDGTFPSIRYTGWEVGDPLGTLQAETWLVSGGGSQVALNRWGDYSAMRIDPHDDCTFWYTQEYQAITQDINWNTRIGSFKFASCGQSQTSTTTTVASSLPTSTFGQSVTLTASVSPSAATGTVQFFDGGSPLGTVPLSAGSASLTTATLPTGTHSITASYSGDATFAGSTSAAITQIVNRASTTTALTSSLNPSTFGQPVTFTATVSPSLGPTGSVQFFDGATSLGTVALSGGSASLTTATLSAGTHSITASYGGNTNFAGSTSPAVAQSVAQVTTTTSLTSSQNPSTFGQAVTLTATVSPDSGPTGNVQFFDGGTSLGTASLSGGVASMTTSTLTVGTHSITASYGGNTNFTGSTSSGLTQTVNQATTTTALTSSLNPSTYGQQVTFTATVSPSSGPTGSVQFLDGGTSLGTVTLSGGTASLTTATLTAGPHSITATYGGNTSFAGSTSSAVTQTVNQASTATALISSLDPSVSGQPVTFTATVNPSSGPTGTVQFFDGNDPLGTVTLSGGTASFTTSTLAVGTHFITANYGGDANFAGSTSASLTQAVSLSTIGTTTVLTSSLNPSAFGQQVTFSATVSPPGVTGSVTFMDGGVTLGTSAVNASGLATFLTSALSAGTHVITAQYNGDATHTGSTSLAVSQTVKATTTITLASNGNPSKTGQPVTFTATVSPSTATGTVQFFDGSTSLGTVVLSSSQASLTTSPLNAGKHPITAVYSGDAGFQGSTSAVLTQNVTGKK